MTTITDLSHTINKWTFRLRTQRALTWSMRGLTIGLAIGLISGLIGLFRFNLLRGEFLALVASILIIVPVITSLIAYLWPVDKMQAARYFDRVFKLNERVSTALELNEAHSNNELISIQLEDALRVSRRVKPNRDLPLRLRKKEFSYAFVFALAIGLVWFRGEQWFVAAQHARAVQQAIEEQSQKIEETVQQIQANEALTDQQKEQFTAILKEAQQGLKDNPSLEGSVSTLTNTSEKLQALSNEQTQQMSQALQQAGNEIAQQDGSPLQGVGEALAQGNTLQAASELANIDVNQLDAGEANQLAQQLDQLANSVQSTNPGLANELQNAADALRRGDMQAAQQALNNASQMMAQAGQQITGSQVASQTAQQLEQGAGQIITAGGGQSQQTQNGQGQGQQGQGQGQQGDSQGGGQGNGSTGSGSGSGDAQGQGPEAGNDPISQNNGPGNGGEESYEQIYAPTLLGGDANNPVTLPGTGEGGDVIGQGPTNPSEPGQSLVPYTEVYSQYDEINRKAIESGNVPADYMSIIRSYFDSLQP